MTRHVDIGGVEVQNGIGLVVNVGEHLPGPAVATNIPAEWEAKPFEGRRADFDTLDRLLDDKTRPQLVALCGGPGYGKSHLAVRYALERRQLYPGGVFLFEFGHSGPPTNLSHWPVPELPPIERWLWVLSRLAQGQDATLLGLHTASAAAAPAPGQLARVAWCCQCAVNLHPPAPRRGTPRHQTARETQAIPTGCVPSPRHHYASSHPVGDPSSLYRPARISPF